MDSRRWFSQLKDGGQFYRLFEHVHDLMFFVKDKESRLIMGNHRFLEHCGFATNDELSGKFDYEIFPIYMAEKFRSDDFYVLIHPGSGVMGRRMIPYFESAGIKYLDYSNLIDRAKKEFHLEEGDGAHPTALLYKIVAERLVKDIGIGEGSKNQSQKHHQ